jgi:large subunit ribosomal protein L21
MAKFAVIQTGGKQYKVAEGDELMIETLEGKSDGDKVSFEEVLLTGDDKTTNVGTPMVSGKKVEGKVIGEGRDEKISVIRFKSKSRYRKNKGHRQPYTKVLITKI